MSVDKERLGLLVGTLEDVLDELRNMAKPDEPETPEPEEPEKPEEPEVPENPDEEEPEGPEPGGKLEARFTASANGLTVRVDRTSSIRPTPTGLKTEWDFGDGWRIGKAKDSHTYASGGTKRIQLRITQVDTGEESVAAQTVPVIGGGGPTEPPPDVEPLPEPIPDPDPLPDPDPGTPPTVPPDIPPTPSKLPVILSRTFDHRPTSQELRAAGWDDTELRTDPDYSYVADPLGSGRQVLRIHTGLLPKGGTATIPNIQTLGMKPVQECLLESEMMVDADFEGEGTGENKRWWLGFNGVNNNVFLTYRCRGTGPVIPGIKLQGSLDPRGETSPNGLVTAATPILRGKKYRFGIYVRANDAPAGDGQRSNGILALLIDGVEVDRITDVNFTLRSQPTKAPRVTHAQFSNTFGGGMKPTKAFNDYIYDVIIRGR